MQYSRKRRRGQQIQPASGPEKAFGQALREVRQNRKLSQQELAFECGHRTYISLVERGIRSPPIRTVVKLAEVLKVSPSEIVGRMEGLLKKPRKKAERKAASLQP